MISIPCRMVIMKLSMKDGTHDLPGSGRHLYVSWKYWEKPWFEGHCRWRSWHCNKKKTIETKGGGCCLYKQKNIS